MSNNQGRRPPFKLPSEVIVPNSQSSIMSLQQAMTQASQLQAQGKLQESESLLQQILRSQPDFSPAIHLLGVIAHQCGQNDFAIELIQKAVSLDDRVPLFHANLGEMLRIKGDLDAAIEHGKRALQLEPNMVTALSNLGVVYYDKEEYETARQYHKQALALDAGLPQSLNNMGSILREDKKPDQAIEYYHKAIAANPNYLEPMNNLGLVLIEERRHAEAIGPLTNAIRQNQNYSDAWCSLGCAYAAMEQFEKGAQAYQRALETRPDYVEAYMGLARINLENENVLQSEAQLLRALEINPDKPEAHSLLGRVYNEMVYPDKAAACYAKALSLDPQLISAYLGRGHMHMERGNFDVAQGCFNQALALTTNSKESLAIHFEFIQSKKMSVDSEHFKTLLDVKEPHSLKGNEAINYYYALAKCYDDTGEYERAFEIYMKGAGLKRQTISYDPNVNTRLVEQLMSIYTADWINQHQGSGNHSAQPIFILGMPRSGTTLTEQIIASHPRVYGAGELPDLKHIADRLQSPSGSEYPANLSGLNPQGLKLFGDEYIKRMAERSPHSARITDKMPGNFQLLGLIHLILPNARIIHVMRDPLDTCISGFTRLFRKSQNQSYDLYELGRFYRDYMTLMQHWRQVLPQGAFYEVQYEQLVQDYENQARRLIAWCGLDWNQACLQPHKTRRIVKTASITQVRQPIYTSSLQRWRRYQQFLGPLQNGLDGLRPND